MIVLSDKNHLYSYCLLLCIARCSEVLYIHAVLFPQYENAFTAHRLQNYQVPADHKEVCSIYVYTHVSCRVLKTLLEHLKF